MPQAGAGNFCGGVEIKNAKRGTEINVVLGKIKLGLGPSDALQRFQLRLYRQVLLQPEDWSDVSKSRI